MRFKLYLIMALIGLAGCDSKKPYEEPTGLLLYLTVISFAIAVFAAFFIMFTDNKNTDSDQRGTVALVGFVFLAVALLLLFSSTMGK
jgi:cell division protein FtsW (lipid II flippase)